MDWILVLCWLWEKSTLHGRIVLRNIFNSTLKTLMMNQSVQIPLMIQLLRCTSTGLTLPSTLGWDRKSFDILHSSTSLTIWISSYFIRLDETELRARAKEV